MTLIIQFLIIKCGLNDINGNIYGIGNAVIFSHCDVIYVVIAQLNGEAVNTVKILISPSCLSLFFPPLLKPSL